MMRISWDTKYLGTFHSDVEESEVFERLKALAALGFTPEVSMLDTTENK